MKCLAICLLPFLASCGILNVGSTNEDGTPKTGAADARAIFRSVGDAALQTWGTQAIKDRHPAILAALDLNGDGILTLAEMEQNINLEDPDGLTKILVVAITVLQAQPR